MKRTCWTWEEGRKIIEVLNPGSFQRKTPLLQCCLPLLIQMLNMYDIYGKCKSDQYLERQSWGLELQLFFTCWSFFVQFPKRVTTTKRSRWLENIFFGISKLGKLNWKSTEKEIYYFFGILKCGKTELEIHLWNGVQQMKKPTTTATERYHGHYFRYFYNNVQLW